VKALRILAGVGYPFLVFAALSFFHAQAVALVLVAALAVRAFAGRRLDREQGRSVLPLVGLVGTVLVLAAIFNEGRFFLFVPTLINLALLVAFARTLGKGPSMVETAARLQGARMTEEKIRHCRTVTVVWCVFFVLNSGMTAWLALRASLAWWTVYTGIVAYVLVGLLFTAELVYRAWRFRDYRDGIADGLLRRIFPPPDPAR